MTQKTNLLLLALGAGLVLFSVLYARLGFFIIDEVIYLTAADVMRQSGSLILDNGLELGASRDLFWTDLLSEGPDGITSQYPVGTTYLWAPLLSAFDVRGIIVLHALMMAGAVFATRALALQMFESNWIALVACLLFLFGTFALEYAFTIWPHAVSVLTVTTAFLFLLKALESDTSAFRLALISGLILGAGMPFRVDNVLALPGFAVIVVLYAAQPMRIALGGAVGVTPALLVMAWANFAKFGSFNPLSYGNKPGLTNIDKYLSLGVVLLAALAALYLWRKRPVGTPRFWLILGLAATSAAILAVPDLRNIAYRLMRGSHRLLLDAREIESPFTGVVDMPDGTKSFWGLPKKALAQSLPWLGLLAVLLAPRLWKGRGPTLAAALLFTGMFLMPFLLRSWHGGMSSNMRYFLPTMPIIAILAALVLRDLLDRLSGADRALVYGGPIGVLCSVAWMFTQPSGLDGAHQILSLYVFLAVLVAALVLVVAPSGAVTRVVLVVAGIGIGVSLFNTGTDVFVSQLRRQASSVLTDLTATYDGKVLIYDRMLRSAILDPDQIVATPTIGSDGPDPELVRAAIEGGYRVLMPDAWAEEFVATHTGFQWSDADGPVDLAEVARAP